MAIHTLVKPITEERVQEVARLLVSALRPECILLFGSQATGVTTPDSDLDLIIVVADCEDAPKRRAEVFRGAMLALRNVLFPVDILVYTRSEIEQRRLSRYGPVADALSSGKVLYGYV